MTRRHSADVPSGSTFALALLMVFLSTLWLAGGASRADALGQSVVRAAAWLVLIAHVVVSTNVWSFRPRPVALVLAAATALLAFQLIPLPPSIWMSLPGRQLFAEAALIAGQPQPWRPLSISPSATANALGSMVVPVAAIVALSQVRAPHQDRLVGLIIALVAAGCVLGLLQMAGVVFDNPLINDVQGTVGGNFANRNHFALFIAIGCVLLPLWAMKAGGVRNWRLVAAIGLTLIFLLLALGTGSRMGMVLVTTAMITGVLVVRRRAIAELRRLPRGLTLSVLAGVAIFAVSTVVISITLGRAVSVDRIFALEVADDLRTLARPTILAMTAQYFPFGSGFGTFDAAYRIAEPDPLLNITYLNHAHNDWVEVVLDGGLPAVLLLGGALIWWVLRSWRVWQHDATDASRARAGSAIILLVMIASTTDYPARTPMIMALLVVGAVWLAADGGGRGTRGGDRGSSYAARATVS